MKTRTLIALLLMAVLHPSAVPQTALASDLPISKNSSILANCEFFNLDGIAIRKYPGDLCVPFDNGDLVAMGPTHLTKFDKRNQVLWSHPEQIHHQMKKSILNNDVLAISSRYTETTKVSPMRHDLIKVIAPDGKTTKQFDFSTIFSSKEQNARKQKRNWHPNWRERRFYEYTHINSISEIVRNSPGGRPQLHGYIVNDRATRRIFIFDPDLKKVLETYELRHEPKHDVSFLGPDTIIYYANHNADNRHKSYVATYNLKTSEKKILYGNAETQFYSTNNGGVQKISDDLFLISHSPAESESYAEFVTAKGLVLKKIILKGTRKLIQDAKLSDNREFLKNNIGN